MKRLASSISLFIEPMPQAARVLDLAYLSSFGKATLPSEEMNLKPLSKKTLDEYTRRFPPRVAQVLKRLL